MDFSQEEEEEEEDVSQDEEEEEVDFSQNNDEPHVAEIEVKKIECYLKHTHLLWTTNCIIGEYHTASE